MAIVQVTGIDPGLVHTGLVNIMFYTDTREVRSFPWVIDGPDAARAAAVSHSPTQTERHIFIERYRPRGSLNHNVDMVKAESEFKAHLPAAKLVLNTGVKQVIRKPLMELLEIYDFPIATNHQDLRSAARIALFGMVKDDHLNELLTRVVRDHIEGNPWNVNHH